jgi:3-hydroxyacyl-[acyl-carrier-protein] dehydratase
MLKKMLENSNILTKIPSMKFILIDKIVSFELGSTLTATKSVSLAEEYLADHFPVFPVLPGVLLLEGLIESASWLVRKTQDFSNSMVLLQEAKNVRYNSFAAPGMKIQYTVTAKSIDDKSSIFKGIGVCGDTQIVSANLVLRHFNLAEKNDRLARTDRTLIDSMKQRWNLLSGN